MNADASAMPLVEIEGLSFRYLDSERWTLTDVDLEISQGEIVVLAGQSGCGKSTLLRSISGLIPHLYPGDYKGLVAVDGKVVSEDELKKLTEEVEA